jgi:myotubularin-related protein 14
MAGARAAAAASAGSSASSGNPPPQEPGLGELLEEFSRTQYRAKDGSGSSGSKVSAERTGLGRYRGMLRSGGRGT